MRLLLQPQPPRYWAGQARPTSAKVTVLTPVYNEAAVLQDVLRRFQAQRVPDGEIEFLFIDGASTDATRAILEKAAAADRRIKILDNPGRVTSMALNIGLTHASGEYVARMDAHALYPETYLMDAIARLEKGDAAAVSGPQVAVGRGPWSRRIALALTTPLGVGGSNFRRPIVEEMETDSGFTGVWPRDTVVALGGWDELAYPNEDSELAARIRERGGRLFLVPSLVAEYTPRNSLRALSKQYWRYGRARARTARLHPISMRRSHALPPALVVTILVAGLPLGRVSTFSRLALLTYSGGLLAVAGRLRSRDAVFVPLVLIVMHLSWGAGYVLGFTYPVAAVKAG